MTDEPVNPPSGGEVIAPSPAPASPPPSPAPASPAPAPAPAEPSPAPAPSPSPAPAYKIPDAYKDKPWAAKIKSEDDLYKQIDTLDALKGKKMVVPDLSKATDTEREEFYAQTRPASIDAYQFGEDTDPLISKGMGESLMKNGISAVQANAIIKDYQASEKAILTQAYSPEGMQQELQKQFGDQWKDVTAATTSALKGIIPQSDYDMMNKLPNQFIGLIYRIAGSVVNKFGVKPEAGHGGQGGPPPNGPDVQAVRAELRSKLAALPQRMHTAEEKQNLINQLNATYK